MAWDEYKTVWKFIALLEADNFVFGTVKVGGGVE